MKNVMHLAGGQNAQDQVTFKNYLNNYKSTIEDTLFGGNVISFFKTSTDPIELLFPLTSIQLFQAVFRLLLFTDILRTIPSTSTSTGRKNTTTMESIRLS
jgi:hypothetical protein